MRVAVCTIAAALAVTRSGNAPHAVDVVLADTKPNDGMDHKFPLGADVRKSDADPFKPKLPFDKGTDSMRSCTGHFFMGCHEDVSQGVKTFYHKTVEKKNQKKMTPTVCFEFCSSVPFSSYFGLTNGDTCWCAPFIKAEETAGFCDMPCVGDAEHTCGGQVLSSIYQMHDCDNLPALVCHGPPPPMPHVRETCPWGDTAGNSFCKVECEEGYDLQSNTIQCREFGNRLTYTWSSWTGTAVCTPKDCGPLVNVDHARFPGAHVFFPNSAEYGCMLGHTTNANATTGASEFSVTCQANGTLTPEQQCLPVICGKSPVVDEACRKGYFVEIRNVRQMFNDLSCPGDSPGVDQTLVYSDEAVYECETGYTLNAVAGGPNTFRVSCQANGNFSAPKECRPVVCGPSPDFLYSGRPTNTEDPGEPVVFPLERHYSCRTGFTLDGTASRANSNVNFKAVCQADGTFSSPPACQPISCGQSPVVANAANDAASFVYPQKTVYKCAVGHTLDASGTGSNTFKITCDVDGMFKRIDNRLPFAASPYVCQPVDCGTPPVVQHATTASPTTRYTYNQVVSYVAEPGYSTSVQDNPYTPSALDFSIRCLATGQYSAPAPVREINDCLVHHCGRHGKCVDTENPGANPDDNYRCDCDSGYEQYITESGEKRCRNINDCPTGDNVCNSAGTCTDLVNAYKCECTTQGYHIVDTSAGHNNNTCSPKICGVPETLKHATYTLDGSASPFPTDVVPASQPTPAQMWFGGLARYTCDTGYTLSGVAATEATQTSSCQFNGRFTRISQCKPVNCGAQPVKAFAKAKNKVSNMLFKGYQANVKYQCDSGYSLNGLISGPTVFEMGCEATGSIDCQTDAGCECQAVLCPSLPTPAHAVQTQCGANCGTDLHFPAVAHFLCNSGYSTNQQPNNAAAAGFSVSCLATSHYSAAKECDRIKCGPSPVIARQSKEEKDAYFGDAVQYTLDTGYTLDGNAGGVKSYSITCQADGSYTATQPSVAVRCGAPASVANADVPSNHLIFKQKALYQCRKGHSTDAHPTGVKTFEVECQADGTFTAGQSCQPVTCGAPTPPTHSARSGAAALSYGNTEMIECNAGYSTTGMFSGARNFTIRCEYDGELTGFKSCKNINDCAAPWGVTCNDKGTCQDHASPTGVHLDDYSCHCESGFEQLTKAGVKGCYNINDCPTSTPCSPGVCEDMINAYKCTCPTGYHQERNGNATCERNVCGAPPALAHASAASSNALVYEETVDYTCENGHTLTGRALGDVTFTVTCHADRALRELKLCQRVTCGSAPTVDRAVSPSGEFFFGDQLLYTCMSGYSTDGLNVANNEFHVDCKPDGAFSALESCLPVKCGVPTLGLHQTVVATSDMHFGDSRTATCAPGYTLSGMPEGATTYDLHCQSDTHFSPSMDCLNIHDCTAFGETCGGHGKCVDLASPTGIHIDDYECDCHSGFEQVLENGHHVCTNINDCPASNPCAPGSCHDQINAYNCQCPRGYHSEGKSNATCARNVCGPAKARGNATFESTGDLKYEDTVTYTCDAGYTLNGQKTGATSYAAECKADRQVLPNTVCKPLTCGPVPDTSNAVEPQGSFVFKQKATVTCEEGYTVTGRTDGAQVFTRACTADGSYDNEQQCQAVLCGKPTAGPHSKVKADAADAHYTESVTIVCDAGYSLTGLPAGATRYDVQCQANGKFAGHQQCQNIDDCAPYGIDCGTHGSCEDLPNPTGNHDDDYKCHCEAGFEEMTDKVTGKRYCGSTPDCPPNACQPGTCRDLVNDYTCVCPSGFHEEKSGRKRDCVRNVCGKPQSRAHSRPASKNEMVFEDTVTYNCVSGFSFDGTAGAPQEFTVSCLANSTLAPEDEDCEPIGCGLPPATPALNAAPDDSATRVTYKGTVTYQCETGYTLSGAAGDPASFERECLASGQFSAGRKCNPVSCGIPAVPSYTTRGTPASGALSFPDDVTMQCKAGYTTDGLPDGATTYTLTCTADGSFTGQETCTNIDDCGPFDVQCGGHGTCKDLDTPTGVHANDYKCVCESGFKEVVGHDGVRTCENIDDCPTTGNGCNPGSCEDLVNDYTCHCPDGYHLQPSGKSRSCQKNKCGAPIAADNAEAGSKALQYFQDANTFTCHTGYTLDGAATGTKTWTVTCNADGSQTPAHDCQPIRCGMPPMAPSSTLPDDVASMIFEEEVTYSCISGYSLDGSGSGRKTFSRQCEADGTFSAAATCEQIVCGVPTPGQNSELPSGASSKKFGETMTLSCKAGFATSSSPESSAAYEVTCEANGAFSGVVDCANIDDCGGYQVDCGEGSCVDNARPTGVHADDYHCQCSSGFEERIDAATLARACHNIDDCPAVNPCAPGACVDGINDFHCDCPADGYVNGEKRCNRVECPAKSALHSTASPDTSVLFEDEVTYTCDNGYTTDGSAQGAESYVAECFGDKLIKNVVACEPVFCGAVPEVANAQYTSRDLVFPQKNMYNCDTGYTIDGVVGGASSFEVSCLASGAMSGTQACMPVACETPPTVAHATGPSASVTFQQTITYNAVAGYSTDGTTATRSFTATCEADGTYSGMLTMQRVECGVPAAAETANANHFIAGVGYTSVTVSTVGPLTPNSDGVSAFTNVNIAMATCALIDACEIVASRHVEGADFFSLHQAQGQTKLPHGTMSLSKSVDGSNLRYGDLYHMQCKAGYTLDATPTGDSSQSVECLDDGTFEIASESCQPIACGEPPVVPFGVADSSGALTFNQSTSYSCESGYSLTSAAPSVDETWLAARDSQYNGTTSWTASGHTCLKWNRLDSPKFAAVGDHNFCRALAGYPPFCFVAGSAEPQPCYVPRRVGTPTSFDVTCGATGDFVGQQSCSPVNCGAPKFYEHAVPVTYGNRFFEDVVSYTCGLGFTLDGLEGGETSFTVECQANGHYSTHHDCVDIDYCHDNDRCTSNGQCHDSLTGYYCSCNAGYSAEVVEGFDTCVDIDECATDYGNQNCGLTTGHGTCNNEENRYSCSCSDGYEVRTENGKQSCRAVTCGRVAGVQHATSNPATGSKVSFPEQAVYTCETGYTTDGTAAGPMTFTVSCQADASFSSSSQCMPVSCGHPTPVDHAELDDVELFFGEKSLYTCKSGFTLDGTPSGGVFFSTECQATGVLTQTRTCMPLTCGEAPRVGFATYSKHTQSFGDEVEYTCGSGYTTTGQPAGPGSFKVKCDKDGAFALDGKPAVRTSSKTRVMNRLGSGTVSGLTEIQISGVTVGDCLKMCLQSAVCTFATIKMGVQGSVCKLWSGIVDDHNIVLAEDRTVSTYKKTIGMQGSMKPAAAVPSGTTSFDVGRVPRSQCLAMCTVDKACVAAEVGSHCVHHSSSSAALIQMLSRASRAAMSSAQIQMETTPLVAYVKQSDELPSFTTEKCTMGNGTCSFPFEYSGMSFSKCSTAGTSSEVAPWCYTTGARQGGEKPRTTCSEECVAEMEFPTCNPVTCGAAPSVANAFVPDVEAVYKEQVTITCNPGHTTDGTPAGANSFNLLCRADGMFDPAPECQPISCGNPVRTPHAAPLNAENTFTYNQEDTWRCDEHYSLNGQPSGTMTCSSFDMNKGECLPSLDGETNVEFRRRCQATGNFSAAASACQNIDYCQPKNPCGRNGKCSNVQDGDGVNVGYKCQCNEGYEPKKNDDKTLLTCSEDDCNGKTCGEGGTCKDLGKGASDYTCECNSGYELRHDHNGTKTCRRTACVMSGKVTATIPFVPHATWDVHHSSTRAAMAAAMDEGCPEELTGDKQSGYEGCVKRTISGRLCQKWNNNDPHTPSVGNVTSWNHNYCRNPDPATRDRIWCYTSDPLVEWEYCAPDLEPVFTADSITYTCTAGHSTDGSTSPAAKSFTVDCLDSGLFSGVSVCQKVKCDQSKVPVVPNALPTTSISSLMAFGDTVSYACDAGHTVGGALEDADSFAVNCKANGRFSTPPSCTPITCGLPSKIEAALQVNGAWSTGTQLQYGRSASFNCDGGHVLPDNTVAYTVVCQANGTFSRPSFSTGCAPVSCGMPPSVANAAYSSQRMDFGSSVTYRCDEGFTTNASPEGDTEFDVACVATEGIPPTGHFTGQRICQQITATVIGLTADASSPDTHKIAGAQVCGAGICTTSGSDGVYSLDLPLGDHNITATHQDYLRTVRLVRVRGPVAIGQGSGLFMPKVMKPNDMRVVLTWGTHTHDLDLHGHYGSNAEPCHAYWFWKSAGYCANNGRVTAVLEHDVFDGYGPETMFIENVGNCTAANKNKWCRFVVKVKNYQMYSEESNSLDGSSYQDPRNVNMGQSGAKLAVYRGTTQVATYRPPSDFREMVWDAFTIDLSNGALHEGDSDIVNPGLVPVVAAPTVAETHSNFDASSKFKFRSPGGMLGGDDETEISVMVVDVGADAGWAQLAVDATGETCLEADGSSETAVLKRTNCSIAEDRSAQLFQFMKLGNAVPAANVQIRNKMLGLCVEGGTTLAYCAVDNEGNDVNVWTKANAPATQRFVVEKVQREWQEPPQSPPQDPITTTTTTTTTTTMTTTTTAAVVATTTTLLSRTTNSPIAEFGAGDLSGGVPPGLLTAGGEPAPPGKSGPGGFGGETGPGGFGGETGPGGFGGETGPGGFGGETGPGGFGGETGPGGFGGGGFGGGGLPNLGFIPGAGGARPGPTGAAQAGMGLKGAPSGATSLAASGRHVVNDSHTLHRRPALKQHTYKIDWVRLWNQHK